jgi:hypothetical protein
MALYLGYDRVGIVKYVKIPVRANVVTLSGTYTITMNNVVGKEIDGLIISGNSVQDGTPTTEAPIEIKSVGDFDQEYLIKVSVNDVIKDIRLKEPLRKIGTYFDTLDYKGKKITRVIKEIVLTGEETWEQVGVDANSARYYALPIGAYGSVVAHNGLCSHLERTTISSNNTLFGLNITNSSGYNDARILARPDLTKHPTLAVWIEFLKQQYANGTPVTVYYISTEPTEETIEIPKITLKDGTNIVTIDTKVEPSETTITYWEEIIDG